MKSLIIFFVFLIQLQAQAIHFCDYSIFEEKDHPRGYLKEAIHFCYEHILDLEKFLEEERIIFKQKITDERNQMTSSSFIVMAGTPLSTYLFFQKINPSNAKHINFKKWSLKFSQYGSAAFVLSNMMLLVFYEDPIHLLNDEFELFCKNQNTDCEKIQMDEFRELKKSILLFKTKLEKLKKLHQIEI